MAKPEVVIYGNAYPPKNEDETIDVYTTILPSQKYIEFAQIVCRDTEDTWNMKQILNEARKIGADGIIVIGKAGSYAVGSSYYVSSKQYGITAIAIKYGSSF
jgi:precorrin isomerase